MLKCQKALTTLTLFFILLAVAIGSFPVNAQTYYFIVEPDVKLLLPAYNCTVESAVNLYCDYWTWNDVNATAISFFETYISGDESVANFTVSTQNANLSFTSLNSRLLEFTAYVDSVDGNVLAHGFSAMPHAVLINGSTVSTWSYDSSLDRLSMVIPSGGNWTVYTYWTAKELNINAFLLETYAVYGFAVVIPVIGIVALLVCYMRYSDEHDKRWMALGIYVLIVIEIVLVVGLYITAGIGGAI